MCTVKNSNRRDKHEEVSYDFLGFTFKPRKARNGKTGVIFTDFGPDRLSSKSMKKILETIRSKGVHQRVTDDLAQLSWDLSSHVRGWINYFGKINMRFLYPVMAHLDRAVIRWACNRYKSLHGSSWQGRQWLREIYREHPTMFVHWLYGYKP